MTLNGSQSIAGSGAEIVEYQWRFLDGGPVTATETPTITHTYATAGGYRASLVVQDDFGQLSQTASRIIGVGTTGVPTGRSSACPGIVAAGQAFTASGANSTDPDAGCGDRISSYRFSVDGGPVVVRDTPSHTFTGLGPGLAHDHAHCRGHLRQRQRAGQSPGARRRATADRGEEGRHHRVEARARDRLLHEPRRHRHRRRKRHGQLHGERAARSSDFGTTPVTCTAQDSIGNVATSTFNVVVRQPTTPGAVTNPGNTSKPL